MNIAEKWLLPTMNLDAAEIARENALGLEISEFCTAFNMDSDFAHWDETVRQKITSVNRLTFHAPYNELCPAAIDPLIRDVSFRRYEQAYLLMRGYGVKKMILHSGYIPLLYQHNWFVRHSADFWRKFLADKPDDVQLCLENVFEPTPALLIDIIEAVHDRRLHLCLDIGHAALAGAAASLREWINRCAPYLAHVHLHNNYGDDDTHNALNDGNIDVAAVIRHISGSAPQATLTIEAIDPRSSVAWLKTQGFL
ncbi:MAG: sugar phosphate isomerase/epimerase [Peptococcaceae bacterium]|jgi:sugar phosphate isomerase/epimerase|nr:sugar phosphate isomerase/epimerase [Peptococcaceae bacterium]